MGNLKVFENMIEKKLLNLHTAYLAKVISTNGITAKIQPLGMTQAYGESAQKQAPLSNVPIYTQKVVEKSISVVTDVSLEIEKDGETIKDVAISPTKKDITVLQEESIKAGDIVLCVCCERDITEAKKGNNVVPTVGHHSMSDSIIVGVK